MAKGGKQPRAAVIGVGHFGLLHARKMARMPGLELVAVADIQPGRAETVARELGVKAITDYRDLLGGVDAVSIAVTTAAHHDVAAAFLDAGVDVFLEKPIAVNLAEAGRLIDKARERSAILQIGHIERFGGLYTALREVVERPLYIETVRVAPFTTRGTDVSVVLDVMIHDIDLILGLARAPLSAARAVGAPVFSANDDIASARLEFANGCVANLTASRISRKTERRMRFFQHDCYVSADFERKSLLIARRTEDGDSGTGLPIVFEDRQFPDADALGQELEAFLDSVRHRHPPAVSGEDGRAALAAAIMISESLQAHRELLQRSGLIGPVSVTPDTAS